ncbi:MAG: ferredoxin--NADP(+) reductase [Pelagibacteraceae bacterium TMED65]|nr:ferredoxin--NADP(+) reductase [Rickettsiales bacterium]OUU50221.1 MAG: ferredoxin--NADP(+) reductase [Pelagibacteraceae bacterium TMED65]|tara:strand:- start:1693 stop:2460 length:768 start_codon:yes stop_codon:yes gene_type:complete
MALLKEKVTEIHHWTDKTFSFKTTRDPGFRFKNGEFAMIGLEVDGKPLLRAYSVVSPNHEDHLEFLSIKVPNGPLTSKLQHIKVNDEIIINSKPTGTLVCDYLLPGRNLFLFSTGTGLAPFMSIVRDPETYEKFQKIILTHTVRTPKELAYKDLLDNLNNDEIYREVTNGKFIYFNTVTRENWERKGRITDWIKNQSLWNNVGSEKFDPSQDRVMICGSESMTFDLKKIFEDIGSQEGSTKVQGGFVIEKAFAEK